MTAPYCDIPSEGLTFMAGTGFAPRLQRPNMANSGPEVGTGALNMPPRPQCDSAGPMGNFLASCQP